MGNVWTAFSAAPWVDLRKRVLLSARAAVWTSVRLVADVVAVVSSRSPLDIRAIAEFGRGNDLYPAIVAGSCVRAARVRCAVAVVVSSPLLLDEASREAVVELAAGSVVRIGDAAARAWLGDTTSEAELARLQSSARNRCILAHRAPQRAR